MPCDIHSRSRNMPPHRPATDWLPPRASGRHISHRYVLGPSASTRGSPGGSRNWFLRVRIETMPEIRLGDRIVGPVAQFSVLENYSSILIFVRIIRPNVIIAPGIARHRPARSLKPNVLVARMVQYQFGDHLEPCFVGRLEELAKVIQRSIRRMHVIVVCYVIAIIPK